MSPAEAEQRVFGDAYTLRSGISSPAQEDRYYSERISALQNGESVWIARNMDSDSGVIADYYNPAKSRRAVLEFEFDTLRATVHGMSKALQEGVLIADQTDFEVATEIAEDFCNASDNNNVTN